MESAIRKLFSDSLETPGKGASRGTYWGEWAGEEMEDAETEYLDQPEYQDYLAEAVSDELGGVFEDLLELDDEGQVYMVLDEGLPPMMDEADAVELAGSYMSFVYYETADRVKGKGKGKGKHSGKGKGFRADKGGKGFHSGKSRRTPPGVFGVGVYGTYLDHRRALRDARSGRGFSSSSTRPSGQQSDGRPRVSLAELKSKTRCHQCKQLGHWSKECPLRRKPAPTPRANSQPNTAMFFVSPGPERPTGDEGDLIPMCGQYMVASSSGVRGSGNGLHETEMYLSYTFASSVDLEGHALVDTAAQHGLIGAETLEQHDRLLRSKFGLCVQYSQETGGSVRGVCGSEQETKLAYIPMGLCGMSGVLKVQVVPGHVPCLLPVYLLTALGSVIDLQGLKMYYTRSGAVQELHRRPTGHVSADIMEFGANFNIPSAYRFESSEVWCSRDGSVSSPELTVLHAGQATSMPTTLAPLLAALGIGLRVAGSISPTTGGAATKAARGPCFGGPSRTFGSQSLGIAASGGCTDGSSWGKCSSETSEPGAPGRPRPQAAFRGTPGSLQVPGSGAANVPALCDETRGQCGVELDQVRALRQHGDGAEVDPRPAHGMEQHPRAPEAGLRDPAEEERGCQGKESQLERSKVSFGDTKV